MLAPSHGSNALFRRRRAARSRNAKTSSVAAKVVDGCASTPALTVDISAPSCVSLAPTASDDATQFRPTAWRNALSSSFPARNALGACCRKRASERASERCASSCQCQLMTPQSTAHRLGVFTNKLDIYHATSTALRRITISRITI